MWSALFQVNVADNKKQRHLSSDYQWVCLDSKLFGIIFCKKNTTATFFFYVMYVPSSFGYSQEENNQQSLQRKGVIWERLKIFKKHPEIHFAQNKCFLEEPTNSSSITEMILLKQNNIKQQVARSTIVMFLSSFHVTSANQPFVLVLFHFSLSTQRPVVSKAGISGSEVGEPDED